MNLKKLKIKVFADGADFSTIFRLNKVDYIKGFTTNPSLMRKSGIKNYKKFATEVVKITKNKPVSFEIFADDLQKMQEQAEEIASWGKNIFVKIPITNTQKKSTKEIIYNLSKKGIKLNITAIFTNKQLKQTLNVIDKRVPIILSVFAGRIADTGRDPEKIIKESVSLAKSFPKCEILWASTRETYNLFQAEKSGCHIITIPHEILNKFGYLGKNLDDFSLETVKGFYDDAKKAKFKI